MKTKEYQISCAMGRSRDWPFSEEVQKDLDTIGYSGVLNGNPITFYEYLESISTERIKYNLTPIKRNGFNFTETYLLTIIEAEINSENKGIVTSLSEKLGVSEKTVIDFLERGILYDDENRHNRVFLKFIEDIKTEFGI
jgi:hypothetical protein